MTHSYTSDPSLPNSSALTGLGGEVEGKVELADLAHHQQPAIIHPNFDPKQTPLDPARSLIDIPDPTRRENGQLRRLYGKLPRFSSTNDERLSKWDLLASEPFAEHLALLSAARLIELPNSFYHYNATNEHRLLTSIGTMRLLDMTDIQKVIADYPQLTRFGFLTTKTKTHASDESGAGQVQRKRSNADELLNSLYFDDWQVILQPEDFETGAGNLATDIMACSVAVHALKQCSTRKTINKSYSATQICHYVRSYLLSQLTPAPASRRQYRQIRLFSGHIIMAAQHLGWDMQLDNRGRCYFNISSRCALLNRYANMQDYAINGWSM